MPSWAIITFIILFVLVVACIANPDKKTRARLNDLLSSKPERNDQDYFDEFYSGSDVSEEVVSKIRYIFCEQTGIALKSLEPDDDLSGDYSLIWALDSMADVEIVIALEQEFGIEISDAEASSMKSIRDISVIITSKLEEKNGLTSRSTRPLVAE